MYTVTMQKTTMRLNINGSKTLLYKLRGIVMYKRLFATLGHYTAFFRSNGAQQQWFCADDTQVIDKEKVNHAMTLNPALFTHKK